MKYTEEEIIKHLQVASGTAEREQGAAMLLEQYTGLLWSVCQRRLSNAEDIKECVNSTFAEICLHPERYDAQKGSLKNYLCMVADRKAIDRYHENERRQQAEEAFVREEQTVSRVAGDAMEGGRATNGVSMAASDGYASGDDRAADKLEEALAQLDPIDSQILRMKYYDGMTYQEIAHQLGLTEGTVKMRSLRSRKKLFKILIVVLILALLAACAVAVLRRYQYTEKGGVSWSSEPLVYEMTEGYSVIEGDLVRYEIKEAYYRVTNTETLEGELTVYFNVHWLGEKYEGWQIDLLLESQDQLKMISSGHQEPSSRYEGVLDWFVDESDDFEYEWTDTWHLEQLGQKTVTIPLYKEGQWITDLVLEPTDFFEYEDQGTRLQIMEDLEWQLGPATVGEKYATIPFFQFEEGEWSISSQVSGTRYSRPDKAFQSITLTGEDGVVYNAFRASHETHVLTDDDEAKEYDLYFTGVEAGTYRLHIPHLILTRDWTSQEIVLTLPQEENVYTACDVTSLFPDGSGIHIVGITKEEWVEISYDESEDGKELIEQKQYCWKYTLELETISVGSPAFLMAAPVGTGHENIRCGMDAGGVLHIKIPQEEDTGQISLCFTNPEYILEKEFAVEIVLQKVTE